MSTDLVPSDYYLFSIEFPERSAPIRGRSIMDLYRAYSIGGLVGFVGSGASVSLGYDTWRSFAKELGNYVADTVLKDHASPSADDAETTHRKKLADALKAYSEQIGAASTAEIFDVLALAGELAELLEPQRGTDGAASAHDATRKEFGKAAAANANRNRLAPPTDRSLASFYQERFQIRSRRAAVPLEPQSKFDLEIRQRVQNVYESCLAALVSKPRAGTPIPADYMTGEALLRSLSEVGAPLRRKNREPAQPGTLLTEGRPSLDVLGCLRNGWKIARYVTLNYDHEIERTLEDYSFPFYSLTPDTRPDEEDVTRRRVSARKAEKHKADARSRLGERALSIDLCPENMGELILFAANFSSARLQVLHLHGSVRDPSTMIVNDRDYNARYYVDNGWSSVLEDGQTLLFRGNGILFVGIGMNEDELLRPLRILAESAGREGHPVFTFLPSAGDHKDMALAIKLYQRYGIRTVFYGTRLGIEKEFGSFSTHPLVRDWKARTHKDGDGSELETLPFETDFLWLLSQTIEAAIVVAKTPAASARKTSAATRKTTTKTRSDSITGARTPAEELRFRVDKLKAWFGTHATSAAGSDFDIEEFPVEKLPRLLLTPWHSDIFKLLLHCVLRDRFEQRFSTEQLEAMHEAARGLSSAITTRALADGLDFVVDRASSWRRRWTYFPGFNHPENTLGAFRRLPIDNQMPHMVRRHVCKPQPIAEERPVGKAARKQAAVKAEARIGNKREEARADGEAPPSEPKDIDTAFHFNTYIDAKECDDRAAAALASESPVVLCNWSTGKGKGRAASVMAEQAIPEHPSTHRAVIVFSQSCEFDSCFDLLAQLIVLVRDPLQAHVRVECVLVHADLVFSKATKLPKLAEWDVVLRLLIDLAKDNPTRVKLIVLCEYPDTRNYFRDIAGAKSCERIPAPALLRETKTQVAGTESVIRHIVRRCKSRWVALFLTRLIVRINCPKARQNLLDDICHGLRLVQDPRQRVALVVDVAMNHLERHIIAHGSREARLHKIIAHAVMRHLFALGIPVRREVLLHCPEIKDIFRVYKEEKRAAALLNGAAELLLDLRLVLELHRHVEHKGNLRLGLHGSTRSYLTSKKALPFSRVQGREQAALTVLPVLAEEVVPLEADDFAFLGDLFDALVGVYESLVGADQMLAVECIRAAFGLLRGSMRIGVVLRATPSASEQVARSPLDSYFLRLLAIRLAAVRVADLSSRQRHYAWPLYEREWVWLFNEMGVVRILQGNIYDAIPLLEQAIDFEEARLRREAGYERVIYAGRRSRRFSVSRLRIFINLTTAALERGTFDRVSRIAERDLATLRKRLGKLAPPRERKVASVQTDSNVEAQGELQVGVAATPEQVERIKVQQVLDKVDPHRELRILVLACELTNTRVQHLSGAIGSAERWLRRNRKDVLEVGVHGLTASFFKVFADVKQRKGDSVRAAKYLSIARAEAEASGRPDIILGVMLAEAEQARDLRASGSTLLLRHHLGRLRKIESEAKRFGMAQIEATACLVRSRLYLGFGEHRSAREDIMRVLTLTMVNGLRVKRIAALIVMAALLAADESTATPRGEALQMVEAARREAERMGYKLAAVNAMELEIVLTRRGSIEDWATGRVAVAADSPNASVSQA